MSLYSWPSSTDPQRAITGRGGILTKASNGVRVKLTLENNSKVVLYTRLETENCFHKEGECKVASLGIRKGGVLNLQCRYQAASKDDMITTFDNIIVSDHITPTPLEPKSLTNPPLHRVNCLNCSKYSLSLPLPCSLYLINLLE